MGRGDIDQTSGRWQGVDHEAVGINGHADDVRAETAQELDHRRISRFLDGDRVSWIGEDPRDQIDRVLGAGGHDDPVGGGCDATRAGDPMGE